MPNTITLANGQVVYDLNGDWGGVYDIEKLGSFEEIVRITQKGDQFVGIKLIGSPYVGKDEKTIKGKLKQNGFKAVNVKGSDGWYTGSGKISENGNKIEITAPLRFVYCNITLQRK
jgi:hypothetical protein